MWLIQFFNYINGLLDSTTLDILLIHTFKSSLLINNSHLLYHTFPDYTRWSPYSKPRIIFNLPFLIPFLPHYFCKQCCSVSSSTASAMQLNNNKVSSLPVLVGRHLNSEQNWKRSPYNSRKKNFTHHSLNWPIFTIISFKWASNCKTLNEYKLIISDQYLPFTSVQQLLLCHFRDGILSPNSSNVAASIPLFKRRILLFHTAYSNTILRMVYLLSHHFSMGHVSSSLPTLTFCPAFVEKKTKLGRWVWMAWWGDLGEFVLRVVRSSSHR